jgi:argininosuccinate lyase
MIPINKAKKLWGGRFKEPTDRLVEAFTASVQYDRRLYRYDIEGSIAHTRMLVKQGILKKKEGTLIITGLKKILKDIQEETFTFRTGDEDIHMVIERALIRAVGDVGGKVHTGRSRNDQIALDIRLYLRDEIREVLARIAALKDTLVDLAKAEFDTVMPGYTHLQKAQPVLLSHYLLAYWEMLDRDGQRLADSLKRVNVLPLGAAALAGTGLPLDRHYTAELLGFDGVSRNSMDTVGDRDFVAEFIFTASVVMMHLSRFCEDLILWSTEEFGFIEIADAYTTGSSIMPQKKNPDVAELVRGKTGRVYGHLVTLLTLMKGLPMSYNRDLQEDKEPLFDTVDTVKACLDVFTAMLRHTRFNRERMLKEAARGFAVATDVAEYLTRKGIPFREAHRIVGRIVGYCLENDKSFDDLTLKEWRKFDRKFTQDIRAALAVETSVDARMTAGGTARELVRRRIEEIERQREPKA